jgi:hypothetical protein
MPATTGGTTNEEHDMTDIKTIIDELGQLAAEIADLTERQDALKAELVAAGIKSDEGDLFRATVSTVYPSPRTDWAAVAKKLNPSHQLITAHTKLAKPYTKILVTVRKGA